MVHVILLHEGLKNMKYLPVCGQFLEDIDFLFQYTLFVLGTTKEIHTALFSCVLDERPVTSHTSLSHSDRGFFLFIYLFIY